MCFCDVWIVEHRRQSRCTLAYSGSEQISIRTEISQKNKHNQPSDFLSRHHKVLNCPRVGTLSYVKGKTGRENV
jgi:hypothetical protein